MTQPLNRVKEWEQRRDEANRYYQRGKFQESLDLVTKNLHLARAIPDRAREGYTLNDLGLAHLSCWQPQRALERFHQALLVAVEIGNTPAQATALSNLGSTYSRLGRFWQALEYFDKALPIFRRLQDTQSEVSSANLYPLRKTETGTVATTPNFEDAAIIR